MNKFLSILLIDDDEDEKLLFSEVLSAVDKQIHCEYYNNGERALKWLLDSTHRLPHYIFLDLNMPRMNGMEILKVIKNEPAISKIPVIIYSTSHNEIHQHEAKKLGASLYIVKPYRQVDLRREITFVIETIEPYIP